MRGIWSHDDSPALKPPPLHPTPENSLYFRWVQEFPVISLFGKNHPNALFRNVHVLLPTCENSKTE